MPAEDAGEVDSSLKLISVAGLELRVYAPGANFDNSKRRVQAAFSCGGEEYRLWVTDPLIESTYLARSNGSYSLGSSYLTISLAEPLNDRHYKLVAAIIEVS